MVRVERMRGARAVVVRRRALAPFVRHVAGMLLLLVMLVLLLASEAVEEGLAARTHRHDTAFSTADTSAVGSGAHR